LHFGAYCTAVQGVTQHTFHVFSKA